MTPKRMRIEPGHIGEKQKEGIQYINQLSMDGDGQKHQMEKCKTCTKRIGTNYDRPIWY